VTKTLHSVRVAKRVALAHLAREVVKEDWSAPAAAFRLRVLVGENVGVLHNIRARLHRLAATRQDENTQRALATLEVAAGSAFSQDGVDSPVPSSRGVQPW
jgi:hypothetical protein